MTVTQWLLAPAFIHFALVMVQGLRMGRGRFVAFRDRTVRLGDGTGGKVRWPRPVALLSDNFSNQFEVPVLFYAILAFLLTTGLADEVQAILAWAFVASRIVHAIIHTTTNVVPQRLAAYAAGICILVVMWIWFGLRLFVIG